MERCNAKTVDARFIHRLGVELIFMLYCILMDVQHLREEYQQKALSKNTLTTSPFDQFTLWFEEVLTAKIQEPNAMALATATPEGVPSCRMVLMKSFDEQGVVFFTNKYSCKGQELSQNPLAAVTFWWKELERQVRIQGEVSPLSRAATSAYFAKRPRNSQLGSLSSRQSEVIPSRQFIDDEQKRLTTLYQDLPVPTPADWIGFLLQPVSFEFWQGRTNRTHDRLRYRKVKDIWLLERLSP